MPNRSSKRGQGPKDINQIAFEVVQKAIGAIPKEQAARSHKEPSGGNAWATRRTQGWQGASGQAQSREAERDRKEGRRKAMESVSRRSTKVEYHFPSIVFVSGACCGATTFDSAGSTFLGVMRSNGSTGV